jgi:site-specific DNA recombinase
MSQDPHDQLLLQIRSAVAEYERTLIAERMRRGRQTKLRAGILLPWATTPYGDRVDPERPRDPGGVRIDPAEGTIIRELFIRYLEAPETIRGLVKYLLGLGLPSPRGRLRWSAASVRGVECRLRAGGSDQSRLYRGGSRPVKIYIMVRGFLPNPSFLKTGNTPL